MSLAHGNCRYVTWSGRAWLDVARENGIRTGTFHGRIERGWHPARAATQPTRSYLSYEQILAAIDASGRA